MYESPELLQVLVRERQQELWQAMRGGRLVSDRVIEWLGRRLRRSPQPAAGQLDRDERLAA